MKKLFKWLLLAILVLVIGVVVVLYNPGIIKGPLERHLSDLAGYSITLDGELNIDTGRLIEISADDIRISAPEWASHKDLVALGHLYLALNTASIFRETVLVESLKIDNLQLNLETNADGKGNWPRNKTPASKNDSVKKSGDSIVIFKEILAKDATLRYLNGKTGVEHVFDITSLQHQQQADGMLHTTLEGKFNDRPVEYTDTIGPYANLLKGRDIAYKANGHFGELALKGQASIDDLFKPRQPTFDFDLQGPDIDEITAMLGVGDLGSGGFSLHAKGALADGAYHADVTGQIGDISVDASAQSTDITQLDEFDLSVTAKGPNLNTLTRVFGIEKWPNQSFSLKGGVHKSGSVLNIPGLTMQVGASSLLLEGKLGKFPGLNDAQVKLTVTGDDISQFRELLGISGPARGPFELKGVLDVSPDGAELLNVDLTNALGKAAISGSLGPAPAYTGSRFDLQLSGDNANSVMSGFGLDILPKQPFDLNADIELVKDGLRVGKGALLTIGDERLQLEGMIGLEHGGKGTDLQLNAVGKHLALVLGQYAGDNDIPDGPYSLDGRAAIMDDGLQLSGVAIEFEAIRLKANGTVKLDKRLSGTTLDFDLDGDNLSSLKDFRVVGDTLDIFVAGQPYKAAGRLKIEKNGWIFEAVDGRVGKTSVNFDLLISDEPELDGSSIRLSAKGPGLNELLVKKEEQGLPVGAFSSSAQISLLDHRLVVKDLNFRNDHANAKVDLDLGWPIGSSRDVSFNADLSGDDIRKILPHMDKFEAAKAAFQLNAVGKLQGKRLDVDHFDASIGNLRASAKGSLSDGSASGDTPLALEISSPDISKIGQLKDRALPSMPLELKGSFKGNAEQFVLRDLDGTLGKSQLSGELNVSLSGPRPDIRLVATSKLIDIRPFLKPRKKSGYETSTTAQKDRLIPDLPIPLDAMAAADLNIHLDIDELVYATDSLTNLVAVVDQQSGSLDVRHFSYDAPRGKLNATLSVTPDNAHGANVKIDLDTSDFAFNYSGLPHSELNKIPAFDIDLHVTGQGTGLREIAGSLNGRLYVGSKGGDLKDVDLGLLDTFVLDEIFSVVLPKSKRPDDTHMSCIAAIADISDGVLKTNPALAFDSERIIMVTKGTLDLKTEKLNFNFNATPTNVLKISATEVFQPYLVISGTLAKPVVGVDPGRAVIAGGAAIATMGTTVLAKGLLDRLGNAIPVCEDMLKQGQQKK